MSRMKLLCPNPMHACCSEIFTEGDIPSVSCRGQGHVTSFSTSQALLVSCLQLADVAGGRV
jgi:uncharacterized OB-fold protein